MKIRLLFLLFFTISFSLYTQENNPGIFTILGNSTKHFYVKNGNTVYKKNYKDSCLDTLFFDNSTSLYDIKFITYQNKPTLVSKAGGMVWQIKNDTFKRIDNSFNHKMTNGSAVFVHNDTLMKFGGYGYWSYRNFFTYFSETTSEWEFYPINPTSILPVGVSKINFTHTDTNFYFSGGIKNDPKNPTVDAPNNDVWRFNFNNKTWIDLGTASFNHTEFNETVGIGKGRLLKSNRYGNTTQGRSASIHDYANNELYEIKGFTPSFGITSAFINNDTLYNYRNNKLIGLSLKPYLSQELTSKGSLYLDTNALFKNLREFTSIILILLLLIVLYLYSKNRKRPKLTETGFKFNRVHHPLSSNELKVLNLLVYNKRVESKNILNTIYDKQLSSAQNNRIKLETIENLNTKVSNIMGVKNFINSKKSLKDQRMLIYYSNFRSDFIL